MFNDVLQTYGSRFFLAAGGVGVGLIVLIVVLWILRNRASSPFVRGGRNRQPRLQVLDAAAVDTRRRLVLVRRDNVEHLIMIGGPTDIVIESGIDNNASSLASGVDAKPQAPEAAAIAIPPTRPETPISERLGDQVQQRRIAPQTSIGAASAEITPEPARPRPTPPPEPQAAPQLLPALRDTQPAIDEKRRPDQTEQAADVLETARRRVLPQPQRVEPAVAIPTPAAPARPVETPRSPAAEFKRVLDQEMSGNPPQERIAANAGPRPSTPANNLPRRDPDMAPITGADTELQNEVARIFGEISVNRDK